MRKYFFTITIVTMCSAMLHHILPSRESSYENTFDYIGYRNYDVEHSGNGYYNDHIPYGKDHHGYYEEVEANTKSYSSSSSSNGASHTSGRHQGEIAKKNTGASVDYSKGLKIKSYGYFDYKYFKPEYHVERFYAEEKHSNKYGSDERSSETKERKETNYSAKRLDEYHAKYGNNVAYYGNYKYENSRHPPSGDRLRNYGFHREGGQKESDRQIGEYDNRYYVPYNSNYYRNENDHTHHHTSNYRCGY